MQVFEAPGGPGPYGITVTPNGDVYYASLAGSHIARIDLHTGQATRLKPPTRDQGARRVWSDSQGRVWVSEWNAGQVGMYDPARKPGRSGSSRARRRRPTPSTSTTRDDVWVTDFGGNAILRFDPRTERFTTFRLRNANANVRQLLGRGKEVWGAESGLDRIVVAREG